MDKKEFITYIIQHTEDYPETGELTLDLAQKLLDNLDYQESFIPEGLSAAELRDLWNAAVHDPEVMDME